MIGATHTHSAPDSYALPDGQGGHTGSLPYMQFGAAKDTAAAVNDAVETGTGRTPRGQRRGQGQDRLQTTTCWICTTGAPA